MSCQNQRFTPVLANRIGGLGIALARVAGNQQEVAGTSRIADDFKSNIARADITPSAVVTGARSGWASGNPDFATCTSGGYAQRYNSVNTLQRKAIDLAKFTLSPFTQINDLTGELLQHTLIQRPR
jgi:hypothetical protein